MAIRSPSCPQSQAADFDAVRLAAGGVGQHAAGGYAAVVAALGRRRRRTACAAVGQARGPQPDGLDQGQARAADGRGRRAARPARTRRHHPGADQRQHRHLAGDGCPAQGLQDDLRDAGEHVDRAPSAARVVRRADHLLARRGWVEHGGGARQGAGGAEPRLGDALPVRQPRQRATRTTSAPVPSYWPTCPRSRTSSPVSAPPAR